MHGPSDLLANNRAWAQEQKRRDPEFFERLCAIQRPDYLWIGCSDSRVPANEIVGHGPHYITVESATLQITLDELLIIRFGRRCGPEG